MKGYKKTIALAALLVITAVPVLAKKKMYGGKITVTSTEFRQQGDSLYVGMQLELDDVKLDNQRSLDLIPVIRLNDQKETSLPAITLNGREHHKNFRRAERLNGITAQSLGKYAVLRPSKGKTNVNYNYAIPYESWMEGATLDLIQDLCNCGKHLQQISFQRLSDNLSLERIIIIEPYRIQPQMAYVRPEVEVVKQRAVSGEARLSFPVSGTVIDPNFGNNPSELTKVRDLIESVHTDQYVKIKGISIAGHASPEGTLALNKRLSENRAKALSKYLTGRYPDIPSGMYTVSFGGEDWETLEKMVAQSNMQYRDDVLNIIRNVPVEKGREEQLMRLHSGQPYRMMLADMFPPLRRVELKVNYDVKNFSMEEAKSVFLTRPQNLSLNEMYMISETYPHGSNEFNELFETAARMFPEDGTANLNAAAAALSRGDVTGAERFLAKANQNVPQYFNCLGVLETYKGNYGQARLYLERAKTAGVTQAVQNLAELDKKMASVREIEESGKTATRK